jgi:hypothetical protein
MLGRNIIGGIIFIDNLFIFKKNRRTLHDFVGGTQVIQL